MQFIPGKVTLTDAEQTQVDAMMHSFRGQNADLFEQYMISQYVNRTILSADGEGNVTKVDDENFRGHLEGMKEVIDYIRKRADILQNTPQ